MEDLTQVYFSPTHTTQTVLNAVAGGMNAAVSLTIDLTRPENRTSLTGELPQGPVLLGAPVYAGRLPEDAARCFKQLQGNGNPAILVVLYGNREYEDALLELKNIARDQGFVPLAAGAFIGEHSFSSSQYPIATDRPDTADLAMASELGRKAAALLETDRDLSGLSPLEVPGNYPYKEGMAAGAVPFIQVTEDCDGCGLCVDACPTAAIDAAEHFATLEKDCILCCACIKVCPLSARRMTEGPLMEKARWLNETCSRRKEPELFFAG